MRLPSSEHVRTRAEPRISANELARYMVSTETGKIGIIKAARESATVIAVRYKDLRKGLQTHLADPKRDRRTLLTLRQMLDSRAVDVAFRPFARQDAKLSVEALNSFERMANELGGYMFEPAPARQPMLVISGVDVSVRLDLLVGRSVRGTEQVGGALFRLTKADDESEQAASKRREIGTYAATLVHMHVFNNVAGNREPNHKLCLSIDIQCGDVHVAPRDYAQRTTNLENACRFIKAMWNEA